MLEGFGPELFSLKAIAIHVRFLVVIPLLFACETWIAPQIAGFARYLVRSGLVPEESMPGLASAIERAGWSLLKAKVTMFTLAGIFGMLAGLSLIGLTTSAQANVAERYTLYSIAGVILGGGEFIGGRVSPAGAVLGALTLASAGWLLGFLHISPDWQIGAQGAILIIVLTLRALISRGATR